MAAAGLLLASGCRHAPFAPTRVRRGPARPDSSDAAAVPAGRAAAAAAALLTALRTTRGSTTGRSILRCIVGGAGRPAGRGGLGRSVRKGGSSGLRRSPQCRRSCTCADAARHEGQRQGLQDERGDGGLMGTRVSEGQKRKWTRNYLSTSSASLSLNCCSICKIELGEF